MFDFKTTLKFTGPAALLTKRGNMKKVFKDIVRKNLLDVPLLWHKKYLPIHFTPRGASKYDYQERTGPYQRRKVRKTGANNPMVWSGRLRKEAMRGIEVRSTDKRVTGRLRDVRAVNFSGKSSKKSLSGFFDYPDIKSEITATTADEAQFLAEKLDKNVNKDVKKIKKTVIIKK